MPIQRPGSPFIGGEAQPLSANDIAQQASPYLVPQFSSITPQARATPGEPLAVNAFPQFATTEKKGRPYSRVGKIGINLVSPQSNIENIPQVQGAVQGFTAGVGRLIGGVIGQGDIGQDIGSLVGLVPQFGLDVLANTAGQIPAVPAVLGAGAQGEAWRSISASKQEELKARLRDWDGDPVTLAKHMPDLDKEAYEEMRQSGELNAILSETGRPAYTLGDQFLNALGIVNIPSAETERTWAGGLGNAEERIMAAKDEELTPAVLAVRQRYQQGAITRDQFLDLLVTSGAGYVNDPFANMILSMVLDPANLAAGAGIALGFLRIAARVSRTQKFIDVIDTGAKTALRESASRNLLATTGEAVDASRITDMQVFEEAQRLGSYDSAIRQATESLPARQQLALQPGFHHIEKAAKYSSRILDPTNLIGRRGTKPISNAQMARETAIGTAEAVGMKNYSHIGDTMARFGKEDVFEKGVAYSGSQDNVLIAGDSLVGDTIAVRGIADARPDVIATTRAKIGTQQHHTKIANWIAKRMTEVAILTGGTKADAMARAAVVATRKLVKLGFTEEQAAVIIKPLDEKGLSFIHRLYYGNRIESYNLAKDAAIKALAKKAAGTLTDDEIADVERLTALAERLTLIGPEELTFERAKLLRESLKLGDHAAVRAAVREYDLLAYEFLADQMNDQDLITKIGKWLDSYENTLTKEASEALLNDLPEIADDLAKRGDDGYLYGLEPDEANLWRASLDENGDLTSTRPWMGIVPLADNIDGWHQKFRNVSGTRVDGFMNALERTMRGIGAQITTDKIDRVVRRRFVERAMLRVPTTAADGSVGETTGLTYNESNALFRAVKERAMEASTSPRGMTLTEFNSIIDASKPALRIGMSGRDLMLITLQSFEGTLGAVGLTQKLSGRAKTLGMDIPFMPENFVGFFAERVYPTIRFMINPVFQLQEWVEPWFFMAARAKLPIRRGIDVYDPLANGGKGGTKTLYKEHEVDWLQHHMIQRYRASSPDAQFDMMERSLVYLYGQKAAKQVAAATDERMLSRVLNNLRQQSAGSRKAAASTEMFREFLGPMLREHFDQINPSIWADLERIFGTTDEGTIAVRWLAEKDPWAAGDPAFSFHTMDAGKRFDTGSLAAVNLEENARHIFKSSRPALTQRVLKANLNPADPDGLTKNEFMDKMREAGAHDDYSDRTWKVMQFEANNGDVDGWWDKLAPLLAGGKREAEAIRSLVGVFANRLGITETEMLARTIQHSPVSLMHDELIAASPQHLEAMGILRQQSAIMSQYIRRDPVTGGVIVNKQAKRMTDEDIIYAAERPPDEVGDPGLTGRGQMARVSFSAPAPLESVAMGVSRMRPDLGIEGVGTLESVRAARQHPVISQAHDEMPDVMREVNVPIRGVTEVIGRYGDDAEPSQVVHLDADTVTLEDINRAGSAAVKANLQDSAVVVIRGAATMARLGLTPNAKHVRISGLYEDTIGAAYDDIAKLLPMGTIDDATGSIDFSTYDLSPEDAAKFAFFANKYRAYLTVEDAHVRWYWQNDEVQQATRGEWFDGPAEASFNAQEDILAGRGVAAAVPGGEAAVAAGGAAPAGAVGGGVGAGGGFGGAVPEAVGRDLWIPGGIEALNDLDTPFTPWEAHVIRNQIVDPNDLKHQALKHALFEKMWAGHTIDMSDPANLHALFNNYGFAINSANMNLTRNEMIASRLKVNSMADLRALGGVASRLRRDIAKKLKIAESDVSANEMGLAYQTEPGVGGWIPLDSRANYYGSHTLGARMVNGKPVRSTQAMIEERANVVNALLDDTSVVRRREYTRMEEAGLGGPVISWAIDRAVKALREGGLDALRVADFGGVKAAIRPDDLTPGGEAIMRQAAERLTVDPFDAGARALIRRSLKPLEEVDGDVIFKPWNVNGSGLPKARNVDGTMIHRGQTDTYAYLRNDDVGWRGTGTNANVGNTLLLAQNMLDDPGFYVRRAGEPLDEFGERISHRTRGLGIKTGFFGVDLGDPRAFNRGVHDLHMVGDMTEWMYARTAKGTTPEWTAFLDSLTAPKRQLIADWIEEGAQVGQGKFGWEEAQGVTLRFKPGKAATRTLDGAPISQKAAWVRERIDRRPQAQRDRLYRMYRNDEELADLVGREIDIYGGDYEVFENLMTIRKAEETRTNPWLARHGNGGYQWKLWDDRRQIFDPETSAFAAAHNMPKRGVSYLASSDDLHSVAGFYARTGTPSVMEKGYRALDAPGTFMAQAEGSVIRGATIETSLGDLIIGFTKHRNRSTGLHEVLHGLAPTLLDPSGHRVVIDDLNRVIDEANADIAPGGARYDAAATRADQTRIAADDASIEVAVRANLVTVAKGEADKAHAAVVAHSEAITRLTQQIGQAIGALAQVKKEAAGRRKAIQNGPGTPSGKKSKLKTVENDIDRAIKKRDDLIGKREVERNAIPNAQVLARKAKDRLDAAKAHLDEGQVEFRRAKRAEAQARKEVDAIVATPLRSRKTGWDADTEHHFIEEFNKWIATGEAINPKMRDVFAYFRQFLLDIFKWSKQQGAPVSPEMEKLFNDLTAAGPRRAAKTANVVHYDVTDEMMHAGGMQAVADAENAAHTNVQFRRQRSWWERSLNHPYLGIYPSSYMWGKVMPEMIRALARNPFGLPVPFLTQPVKIRGVEYGLHGSPYYGYINAAKVQATVETQKDQDPEFQKWVNDPTNQQVWRNLMMFLPGTPWELPANIPLWARRLAEWGLMVDEAKLHGRKEPSFDVPKVGGDMLTYAFGLAASADWLSDMAKMVSGPTLPDKPQSLMVGPGTEQPLEASLAGAAQQTQEIFDR